jgi:GNAT superfamily N-acetyltransferase
MVDKKFQKQGIGKAAIEKLFDKVIKEHGNVMFSTSTEPYNTVGIMSAETRCNNTK